MSCATITGYTTDCNKDSLGGLGKIRLALKKDIVTVTEVAGIVTGVTMATGKQFYDFYLVKGSSSFTTVPTANVQNGTLFYAQTLSMVFNKLKATTSALVDALSRASLVALVEDRNGEVIMLGRENGLDVSGGNAGSGAASGDRNGYELQMTGEENKISHVDPTILAALLIPAP